MGVNRERIRKLRQKKKLTQEEAAAKAGQSKQAWNAVERGKVENLTINRLEKMAQALETDVKDLLF